MDKHAMDLDTAETPGASLADYAGLTAVESIMKTIGGDGLAKMN